MILSLQVNNLVNMILSLFIKNIVNRMMNLVINIFHLVMIMKIKNMKDIMYLQLCEQFQFIKLQIHLLCNSTNFSALQIQFLVKSHDFYII